MAIHEADTAAGPPGVASARRTQQRSRSVYWWAAIGGVALVVQVYAFAAWIISGEAYPQTTGIDPVPTYVKIAAWALQIICLVLVVGVITYLWRRSVREGKLTFDALIAVGFFSTYWTDSALNYGRPIFFFNSYLVNLGGWYPHIPGWLSPHGGNVPDPFLMTGPMFLYWYLLWAVVFCAVARKIRQVRPDAGKVLIFVIGMLVVAVSEVLIEMVFLRSQLFAYSAVVNAASLFPGQPYQFPLYEALVMSVLCSIVGMIRLNRDDSGRSVIERGADEMQVGSKTKAAIRILAWMGLANTLLFILNLLYVWIGFYASPMPHYPSYLNNDMCGSTVSSPCPGPGVPIEVNNEPHRWSPPR